MNAQQMIDSVFSDTNIRDNDPQVTRPKVLGWINRALQRVPALTKDAPWLNASETGTLVAGLSSYTMSAEQVVDIRRVTVSEEDVRRVLVRIPADEMDNKIGEVAGAPMQWAWEGEGDVFVFPAPVKPFEVTVEFSTREPLLTDSPTSVPALPEELRELLVSHGCFMAMGAIKQGTGDFVPIDHPRSQSQLRRAAAKRLGPVQPRTVQHWRGV
jgi:hypothetical protein